MTVHNRNLTHLRFARIEELQTVQACRSHANMDGTDDETDTSSTCSSSPLDATSIVSEARVSSNVAATLGLRSKLEAYLSKSLKENLARSRMALQHVLERIKSSKGMLLWNEINNVNNSMACEGVSNNSMDGNITSSRTISEH